MENRTREEEEEEEEEEGNAPTEDNIDNVLKRVNLDAMLESLADEIPLIRIHRDKIKQKLREISSSSPKPDHPPYAFMIEKAITVLDEKEGSSEEAISKFIEDHFQYLPYAHSYLLRNHLWELVRKEDIIYARRNCYRMKMPGKVISSCSNMRSGKNTSKKIRGRLRKNANEGLYWEQQTSDDQAKNPIHIEEESECEDLHQSQEHTVPCGNRKRKVHTGQSLVKPKILVGQFEIHVEKDVKVPNGQENLAAENETETEKEHVQLDNTVIKDVEMPNHAAENESVKEHDVTEKELVQVDNEGHSGNVLECVQFENTLMEDLQMPNNPENRVAEYEEEKVDEESDELKKLREDQKSFYDKVRDLYKTMKRCATENHSKVSADSGPLLFYMGDYKKLFPIVGNVQTQIAEAVVSLADLNVSRITSWQPMVEENISKEHPLLNSLCLENERTPSNSKRPCNIETIATTTSGLFQKHDEQEKACFESEMSKGQPASAAPTSAVCAGPDSEQTLQNTDIQGGATDQKILVSERLQQAECEVMPECENTGSDPTEQGSRLDKSAQEKSKEQELVAASGSLQIKQTRLTREMKRLASTMRTDHESDLKPSHISAATSDDLSMPLVPCRSTPRMKVKASKREVSQNAKSSIAVENQADHDGVSQSVQNQQERSLQRKVVVDKKKGKEKRPRSISDQKNTKEKKSTKRIRCLEASPKKDKVVKRSYLTVPSGVIVALAAQQDKKEKGKSASLGRPLKSKQP